MSQLGRAFVRAGADLIFGHHAHRLQPVDHYRGRPIVAAGHPVLTR